jgi:hypothetical protein
MRIRMIGLAAILAVAVVPAVSRASGGTVVSFTDGRSLVVEGVEQIDDTVVLYLEGGGALSIPSGRVAGWREIPRTDPLPASEAAQTAPSEPAAEESWQFAAGPYAELFARTAEEHELDPALLTAMVEVESSFDPRAVSPRGACGLLQLMPDTADRFGVQDVFDAAQNVEGGARYLSCLLDRYDGRTDLALAGYNAGEGAVDRHRGIPPYGETRRYVRRVLDGAARMADLAP